MEVLLESPERRRHERRLIETPVRLYRNRQAAAGEAAVLDLSPEGFSLRTPVLLSLGETVGFRIRLREGLAVEGTARVRWRSQACPGYFHGLEFENMPFWRRQRLFRHLFPGRLNLLGAADLYLQAVTALVVLFALRKFLILNPAFGLAAKVLVPYFLVFLGGFWVIARLLGLVTK